MKQIDFNKTIARIQQMEQYFDALQNAVHTNPDTIHQDNTMQLMLESLRQYYENGQWLADYTLDEQGHLPPTLKRGVLSQDGVYHLLEQLNR